MTVLLSKIVWCLGVVGWFAIRYPYARRARRVAKVRIPHRLREFILMSVSATGLGIVPGVYVFTDALRFADYPIQIWQPFSARSCSRVHSICSAEHTRIWGATGPSPWRSESSTPW